MHLAGQHLVVQVVSQGLSLLRNGNGCMMAVLGLHEKVLVVGSYRSVFCKKMLEASPMSNRVNSRWF